MGTLIETSTIAEALEIVQQAYETLESAGCNRVYSSLKFDIRKGKEQRLKQKIQSIEKKIGKVNH